MHLSYSRYRVPLAFFFLLAGCSFSSWAARTPYIQSYLGLEKYDWGLLLLCPVGSSFLATLLSNFLISRFSSRRVIIVGAIATSCSLFLIGLSSSMVELGGAFVLFGMGMGLTNIASNEQAATLQQLYQRSIMSSFHGMFSMGAMLGAFIGGAFAKFLVSPAVHLSVVGCVLLLGSLYCYRRLLPKELCVIEDDSEQDKVPLIVFPKGKLWIVGGIATAAVFIEGAMSDWSALFLEDMGAYDWLAALGLAFFTGTMALGRLFGDRWIDYMGAVKAIKIGTVCCVIGLLIALVTFIPVIAIIGFAIAGIGVSVIFPCLLSIASKVKDKGVSSSAAIASVAMMGYVAMMIGPPMIGFLSHYVGLHFSFVALFFSGFAGLWLATRIRI